MIAPESIQEVMNRADIIDVVGQFVRLKKEVPIIYLLVLFIMRKHLRFMCLPLRGYINVLVAVRRAM